MGNLAALGRLIGAGWTLIRNDALLPSELSALYPPWLDTTAGALRVFAGSGARDGRPGERPSSRRAHT